MDRLGPKLRALRTERQLTLETVAERAGLTKGFLSLVERGQTTISVPNLLRLCEILGVPVGSLFDYPESAVVRNGQGAPVGMGGSGIREYLLTPASAQNLQVMRTVLQPGGGTGGAYSLDSETVFVFVVRGDLRLVIDGQESTLGAGDGFTFSARAVHSWDNPGMEESEILWFIVPPLPNRH
jgi:transcriptional regulator with XRE-family HTH domain